MRKTVCYCDICKKETKESDLKVFGSEGISYEICLGCRNGIIHKVMNDKIFILTPWCKVCNGTGIIKESIDCSYDHNQYEIKKCENCKL